MLKYAFIVVLLLASFFQLSIAVDLEGRVFWNDVCADYTELGHSKVILDSGRYAGGIRQDGRFTISDVDDGSYILSVISHDYAFDNLRVDVQSSMEPHVDVRPYVPGTPHNPPSPVMLSYPVTLVPRQKANYFIEHQSFSALSMLKNPMMLMMVVTGVLVLAMPYIMKNLDPEVAKEVNERQARYSNIQNAMTSGDLRGGFSALLAPEKEADSSASQVTQRRTTAGTSSPAKPKGSSKGGKRR